MDRAPIAAYESQLARYAECLAAGQIHELLPDLAAGCDGDDVQRYVDNAVGERCRMLHQDSLLAALAYDDLAEKIAQYVHATPRTAYLHGQRETAAFLDWLARTTTPTVQQADFLAYQRAEFACLELAHQKRTEYVRFCAARRDDTQATDFCLSHAAGPILLNPVRVWSRLSGFAAGYDSAESVDALFLAQGEQIRHVCLDALAAERLRQLESLAPCSVDDWAQACGLSADAARTQLERWQRENILAMDVTFLGNSGRGSSL